MSYRYMSREVFFRFIRDLLGWSSLDTVANLGQGEFRGKVHLSRRCLAVSARNAHRLRRRQPCYQGTNQSPL